MPRLGCGKRPFFDPRTDTAVRRMVSLLLRFILSRSGTGPTKCGRWAVIVSSPQRDHHTRAFAGGCARSEDTSFFAGKITVGWAQN